MPTRDPRHDQQPTSTDDVIEIVDENLKQGFAQMPRPVLRAKGLSLKAKVVYIALLDYAWREGSCFPGQQRLAEDLDTSVDTIQRALVELRTYRLVDWKRTGLNKPNVYYLLRFSDSPKLQPTLRGSAASTPATDTPQGNRKLRFQETAESTHQETANGGSKDTHLTIPRINSSKIEVTTRRGKNIEPSAIQSDLVQPIAQQSATVDPPAQIAVQRTSHTPVAIDEDRDVLTAYLRDFAGELGDRASLKASVTRALHLMEQSGLRREFFLQRLYEARAITKERSASIRGSTTNASGGRAGKNKMPFFFSVLEDLLGLREEEEAGGGDGHPAETRPSAAQNGGKIGADDQSRVFYHLTPEEAAIAPDTGTHAALLEQLRQHHPPQPIPDTSLTTETAWAAVLDDLRATMTDDNYWLWLAPTVLLACDGQTATIVASSTSHRQYLTLRLDRVITRALSSVLDTPITCRFLDPSEALPPGTAAARGHAVHSSMADADAPATP